MSCIVFYSCITEKKISAICIEKYPAKDSIVVEVKIDTLYEYIKGDSTIVEVPIHDSVYIKDTSFYKTKTLKVTKTIQKLVYRENTAKIEVLSKELDNANKKVKELNEKYKMLSLENKEFKKIRLYIIVALVIMSVLFVGSVVRRMTKL